MALRRYEGLVAWVTGAGSGIGEALAVELAAQGASVALSGRRLDRLEAVATRVRAAGREALILQLDVTDELALQHAVERILEVFGRLDVTVANAGMSVAGRFERLRAADWRRQLDVNVVGLVATAAQALPALRQTHGRLVLVGSVAAFVNVPGMAPYNASKAAVRAIGDTLAAELHGTGVSCTTVHPGFVESEIARVDNQGVFRAERPDGRPGWLMWPSDRAARVILAAAWRRRRERVFTGHGVLFATFGRHFPGWAVRLLRRAAPRQK